MLHLWRAHHLRLASLSTYLFFASPITSFNFPTKALSIWITVFSSKPQDTSTPSPKAPERPLKWGQFLAFLAKGSSQSPLFRLHFLSLGQNTRPYLLINNSRVSSVAISGLLLPLGLLEPLRGEIVRSGGGGGGRGRDKALHDPH